MIAEIGRLHARCRGLQASRGSPGRGGRGPPARGVRIAAGPHAAGAGAAVAGFQR